MLSEEYKKRKKLIRNRLEEFSKIPEEDYFYELCFCLLTPGSKARQAGKIVNFLKEKNFRNKDIDFEDKLKLVRFHNNKKKRLLKLKEDYTKILKKIKEEKNSVKLRDYLAENVYGFSYKEASHFLRNIGRKNLVILDRHILKNMVKYNSLKEIPKSMLKNKYLDTERKFRKLARENNLTTDELDLLFWSMETGEVFK